jgi:O-antigen ligase
MWTRNIAEKGYPVTKNVVLLLFLSASLIGCALLLFFTFSILKTLAIVIALVLLLFFLREPFWGLCLMGLLLPLEEGLILSPRFTAVKLMGVVVFMAYLLNSLLLHRKPYYAKQFFILALFVLLMFASTLWSFYTYGGQFLSLATLVMLASFFFLIPQLVDNEKKLEIIFIFNLLGALASASLGLFNLITHPTITRVSATLWESGSYGRMASYFPYLLIIPAFYVFIKGLYTTKKIRKIIFFLLFAFLAFLSFSSGTRSFLIALLFSFLVLAIFSFKQLEVLRAIALIFIFTLVLIMSFNFLPEQLKGRFQVSSLQQGFGGRVESWKMGIVEILEHPLFGVGFGNSFLFAGETYQIALHKYGIFINYPLGPPASPLPTIFPLYIRDIHNAYIQVWAEGGLFAFGIFLWFIISLLSSFIKALKKVSPGSELWQFGLVILASVVTALISAFSEPALLMKYFWFTLALALGFTRIARHQYHVHSSAPSSQSKVS